MSRGSIARHVPHWHTRNAWDARICHAHLGLESIVYGVSELETAIRFFEDFSLPLGHRAWTGRAGADNNGCGRKARRLGRCSRGKR